MIIILLILIICIFLLYKITNNSCKNHKCLISNNFYPEINNIIKNKNIILNELFYLIENKEWSIWGNSTNNKVLNEIPRFSELTTDEKIIHFEKNKEKIINNSNNSKKWKIYGLILEKKPIIENINNCISTFNLIKDIPGLINAGFSCLESHSSTPYHSDKDNRFYRIHIPLIIPNDSSKTWMDIYDNSNNKIQLFWNTDYFVFDDTCYHQAFNNTDFNRIILLLDIERKYN
jgi:aspartyl/asparaginyl beta-hydroxylase (cupin superfamily)